jgi:hypothetical protein
VKKYYNLMQEVKYVHTLFRICKMIKARAKCVKKREDEDESSEEDYDSYSAIDDGNILYHIYFRTMDI